jgi:hypothetical protein
MNITKTDKKWGNKTFNLKAQAISKENFLMTLEDVWVDKLEKSCRGDFNSFIVDDKEDSFLIQNDIMNLRLNEKTGFSGDNKKLEDRKNQR